MKKLAKIIKKRKRSGAYFGGDCGWLSDVDKLWNQPLIAKRWRDRDEGKEIWNVRIKIRAGCFNCFDFALA